MSQVYQFDAPLKKVITRLVGQPYLQDNSPAWMEQVIEKNGSYHQNQLLAEGNTSCTISVNGLTPDQLVLLYCYHYLQMRCAGHRYLYDLCHDICGGNPAFLTQDSIFIDFGCGPMSSALALADYSTKVHKKPLKMNYIGIDRSPAMLRKAREFSRQEELFYPGSRFKFLTEYNLRLKQQVRELAAELNYPCLILNFSYFFASPWVNPLDFAGFIGGFLKDFEGYPCVIFFQNPPDRSLNQNWLKFKRALRVPVKTIEGNPAGEGHDLDYVDHCVIGTSRTGYQKTVRVCYEILMN